MAYGRQHSTTTTTEANFKKEDPKLQKKEKNPEKEFVHDNTEEAFEVKRILK